jgi:hypothetical protein
MPKESIITVFRSTSTDTPTGLTFGELAYSDLNGKLFVGKNDGNSLWVGASITSGAIGDNQYLVPTQSAVKSYVDGIVGGGSVVNSLNGSSGAVTITGDGGAITNVQSSGANTVRARLASTSLTGVASFNATRFTVSGVGAVDIASAYQVTGDTVSAVGSSIASRSNNSVTVDNRLASTSLTGVASFSSTNFDVSGAGAVSVKTGGIANGNLVNSSVTVSAGTGLGGGGSVALGSSVTMTNLGVLSLNGLTGARTLTGDGGALVGVGNDTIRARLASTSATGAASFSDTNFDVSAAGAVSVKTGGISNTNLANSTISGVSLGGTLNALTIGTGLGGGSYNGSAAVTIANTGVLSLNGLTGARTLTGDGGAIVGVGNGTIAARLASTSVTGAASFNATRFTVSAGGAVDIASAYQITGDTVAAGTGITITPSGNSKTIANSGVLSFNGVAGAATLTGDGGAIVGVGNNTVRARLASTSATGAASFSSTNFDVSAAGAVTVKTGGIANTNLVNSGITVSTLPVSLGGTLTITGTANEVDVSASSSTITIGLPDNVTIAGNLTVNGTVVTTNVDTFVVEDPLIMLGTGNAGDSVDLGFYARYDASAKYTGLFRDASDSGVYKLFTGLTVEPTTTVNTGGAGYAMATLVARIDGGTF